MSMITNWLWTAKDPSTGQTTPAQADVAKVEQDSSNGHANIGNGNTKSRPMPGSFEDIEIEPSEKETQDEDQTTPKAVANAADDNVPSFNLDDSHISPVSTAATVNKAETTQHANDETTKMMPPPRQSPGLSSQPRSSSLMPPPSMKAPTRSLPKTLSADLRVPSTGPLPNRGPPQSTASQARNNLAPVANTAGKRNKVLLKPGHSPLDWAALTRKGNLSGVPGLQRVTPSMLKYHNGRKGRPAWSSYLGKVYNITPYVPFHPGGEGELLRSAGKDGHKLFMKVHPWVNWDNMLNSCVVGILVSEEEEEGLDGLD